MCDKHDWSMKLVTRILVPCVSRFPCSLLRLSLSLSLPFSGTPYVYQPVESVATRLVPSDGRNDQDGHLPPWPQQIPIQLFSLFFLFSFAWVIDRGPIPVLLASFRGLLFDRFRVDRLA